MDIPVFTETYRAGTGETVLTGTITASDGVAQAELSFTLSVRFDPSPQYAGPASHLNGQRWEIPQVFVVREGAQTSPAATVAWTSLTTTAFTWAAGTESTPQVACVAAQEDGPVQQPWTLDTPGRNEPHVQRPAGPRKPGGPEPGQRGQAKIYGTHENGGCIGSAVDVVVRVRDITAPKRCENP